jgi:hypothetical protein
MRASMLNEFDDFLGTKCSEHNDQLQRSYKACQEQSEDKYDLINVSTPVSPCLNKPSVLITPVTPLPLHLTPPLVRSPQYNRSRSSL